MVRRTTTPLISLLVVCAQLLLMALPTLGIKPPLELFGVLGILVLAYGVSLAGDWRAERRVSLYVVGFGAVCFMCSCGAGHGIERMAKPYSGASAERRGR